jgi:tRNA pseudouridine38-40 synthase
VRVRAVVAYDGTAYHGFQRQSAEREPTIQGELERAIEKVTGQATTVLGSGRTDAGVHAQGQVVAFDTGWRHSPGDLHRALNAVLADDIAVCEVALADERFHPRYDARSRAYRYTIYNSKVRHPLHRLYALHVSEPLDVDAMRAAALCLIGEHDFAAFGQPTAGDSTSRKMYRVEVERREPWIEIELEANGFLYRMVRSITGALIEVGRGRAPVERVKEILESRDRSQAPTTALPHGLCLMKVNY